MHSRSCRLSADDAELARWPTKCSSKVQQPQQTDSYPDHGDRYRRLRRADGRNEVVLVTQEKIAEEWQRGIECHSALRFVTVYLSGLAEPASSRTAEVRGG